MPNLYLNQDLKLEIVRNMQTYGGSFVQALAECILRADKQNLAKLELAFSDYIIKYHPENWRRNDR